MGCCAYEPWSERRPWDRPGPLWLPEEAAWLAEIAWHRLAFRPEDYSTAQLLRASARPERPRAEHRRLAARVETPSAIVQRRFADVGLLLAPIPDTGRLVAQLDGALARLSSVPGLLDSLASLIWSIHPIEAPNPAVDVSFSDPSIPFSVFVSIPPPQAPQCDLRLAEGLLHEAMHLQLSLVEDGTPLLNHRSRLHYSPWMSRPRPAQGVLHGVYVFSVIRETLTQLIAENAQEQCYIEARLRDIAAEIGPALRSLADDQGLTNAGASFLRRLTIASESLPSSPERRESP